MTVKKILPLLLVPVWVATVGACIRRKAHESKRIPKADPISYMQKAHIGFETEADAKGLQGRYVWGLAFLKDGEWQALNDIHHDIVFGEGKGEKEDSIRAQSISD